jgi:hypothetical protein
MFNEQEWIKLLFLLSDTQQWLNDMSNELFLQIPIENKKKFLRRSYRLTATSFAHIIERHYYKIPRHPEAGKFHIPIPDILNHIREAAAIPTTSMPGNQNLLRVLETGHTIGFDRIGQSTTIISIITDTAGNILTAFPGENTNTT